MVPSGHINITDVDVKFVARLTGKETDFDAKALSVNFEILDQCSTDRGDFISKDVDVLCVKKLTPRIRVDGGHKPG